MAGRNVNIYFQEKTYNRLRSFTGERQISHFVNEAVEEKLAKEKKTSQERLIAAYKRTAANKAMREEDKVYEGSIEDGIDE
jgi:hypothetical protein